MADTMKAVVFHGPFDVKLEDRPIPTIQHPTDVIIKVDYTALCGSELHVFRGHQPSGGDGFIMGHESTGRVTEVGSAVTKFAKGDLIVSPFTTSCGACFYCERGFSSRCASSKLFGCPKLDGGQSEYCRIPDAENTAMKAPAGIEEKALVLMADIFPTGYFACSNAFATLSPEEVQQSTVVLIGLGPVAICSLVNILDHKPKHLLAVDSNPARLQIAKDLGAEPHNFMTGRAELDARVKELTDGRGADVAIEIVGLSPALQMAYELLRPWGIISSVGVHNGEIPWTGNQAYNKNLRVQMGRCPVRSIFPQALERLKVHQDKLAFMLNDVRPLSEYQTAYDDFEKGRTQKVIFRP